VLFGANSQLAEVRVEKMITVEQRLQVCYFDFASVSAVQLSSGFSGLRNLDISTRASATICECDF